MKMALLLNNRQAVSDRLKSLGFSFVSLDLEGFRSGSLNRVLDKDPANKLKARAASLLSGPL